MYQDCYFDHLNRLQTKPLHSAALAATDYPCSLPPTSVALATSVPNVAVCAAANRRSYPSDIAISAIAPDASDYLAAVAIYAATPDAANTLTATIAAL